MQSSSDRRAHAQRPFQAWMDRGSSRLLGVLALLACVALVPRVSLAHLVEHGPRSLDNVTQVTVDGIRIVALSEQGIWVGQRALPPTFDNFAPTTTQLRDVALVGEDLYALDITGKLVRIEFQGEAKTRSAHVHAPIVRRYAVLARMDDYLVAADDHGVVSTIALPLDHRHHDPGSDQEVHTPHAMALVERGAQRLEGRILDIATSSRLIYVLLDDRKLALINARDPAKLMLQRLVPLDAEYSALAANGERVFLTGAAGLVQLDLDTPVRAKRIDTRADLAGRAIVMGGRTLFMVTMDGGLAALHDESAEAITHDVTVGNFFFDPLTLDVAGGDTVRWTNTAGLHNTESCDGVTDPPSCGGGVAVENWSSGAPAFPPWEFEKTFALEGANPYFCRQHQLTMEGTIVVSSAAVAPPGVPDGALGSPVRVRELATPDTLEVSFDTVTCDGDTDHQIVWGFGSQLPAAQGAALELSGAECALGGSPYVWTASPDPALDPTKLVWFLVLANDGVSVEGSWGTDSAGGERAGPGVGGASGECGVTAKDVSNACGI